MDQLRVRLYDVRFGDAILVSVPDENDAGEPVTRHVLIDVGNVLASEGGQDALFSRVLENIRKQLAGRPVDLYVMTHEHMDHVQGLLYGAKQNPPILLDVDTAWLTASAHPEYYEHHPEAKKKLAIAERMLNSIEHRLSGDSLDAEMAALIENNSYRKTRDCVDYLRRLTTKTYYVHRQFDTKNKHPFKHAVFDIWAPEEDTADYYGRFKPMSFGLNTAPAASGGNAVSTTSTRDNGTPTPPAGVDTSAFYNLTALRDGGLRANALTIDKAKNNTSVVFTLTWRNHVLLFSGDAESRSWRTMYREKALKPVDFIKVSHHGSHNGTPDGEILDEILPESIDPARRRAAVSTYKDTYNNVPDDPTLTKILSRCGQIISTQDSPDKYVDIFFD